MTAQAFIKKDSCPLPPMIYGVCDMHDYWQISLMGHSRTIQIQKHRRHDIGNGRFPGTLTLSPSFMGNADIPYGGWRLSTSYIKKKGWILTVKFRNQAGWKNVEFGFWSRHAGHGLPVAVRRIQKTLARNLNKPALK